MALMPMLLLSGSYLFTTLRSQAREGSKDPLSKARVLRLKRLQQLLALSRTRPKPENPHTGTIITARPQRRLGQ